MKPSNVAIWGFATLFLVPNAGRAFADVTHRVILPENRTAYYAAEPIEIAVTNLSGIDSPRIDLVPATPSLSTVSFAVVGAGTQTYVLPPLALAPSAYNVRLDGADAGTKIVVVDGVARSTMLLSGAGLQPPAGNFAADGSGIWGLLDPSGIPVGDPVGLKSAADIFLDQNVARNTPTLITQYWSDYGLGRAWGRLKSWASPDEYSMMRMFNYQAAQRMRKFALNIASIGTINEPNLAPGWTTAGSLANGIPNWDEAAWYDNHGVPFTANPGALSDADWLKYMSVRTGIIKQDEAWAKQDIKTIWPTATFATDFSDAAAIVDGADPMNQEVNDIPATHIYCDRGMGRLGVVGAAYLEKADRPTAKAAATTGGQSFGAPDPQPNQIAAYRLMLNGLLAAGLSSNWWLDTGSLKPDDVAAIHDPVLRYGPLFKSFTLGGHDVAVLWSSTELAMREKPVVAHEVAGDPIAIPITTWPENANFTGRQVELHTADVESNYREMILDTHQALSRAGFAAQIVHEKLLPRGVLKNYKTLVITGQTFALPPDVMKAISDFTDGGGKVVVDPGTRVAFPDEVVSAAKLKDPYWRWSVPFDKATNDPHSFASEKERSYYLTNSCMDLVSRDAALPMLAALHQTSAVPVFDSQSVDLAGERHVAGEGQLYMVLNGSDPLPQVADAQSYSIYNYAPQTASYTLHGIKLGSVVYEIQGTDWKTVSRVPTWPSPQTSNFEAGEMKLYLVAPRTPAGLGLTATADRQSIAVSGKLGGVRMPWPLEVVVADPSGKVLYDVYRSMDAEGKYIETYPLGANSPIGVYNISLISPVGGFAESASVHVGTSVVPASAPSSAATAIATPVRVFDEPSIRTYLASRPSFTIVVGKPAFRTAALKLEGELALRGIKSEVVPESQVFSRARYPRVWDPYITICEPDHPDAILPAEPTAVVARISLSTAPDSMRTIAATSNGPDLGDDWRKPLTLATVGPGGYVDFANEMFYEPGVEIYVGKSGTLSVIRGAPTQVKCTADIQRKLSRPWTTLAQYDGSDILRPELPEAYSADANLILLGNSGDGELNAALQASELLPEVADADYPGPGKALISMAWSPFGLGRNVIMLASSDDAGLNAAIDGLAAMAK